jgi:hypothetical protein
VGFVFGHGQLLYTEGFQKIILSTVLFNRTRG